MSTVIYEPKGKAREYSPLALNLYNGCGHGCEYCYVPSIFRSTERLNRPAIPRANILRLLEKDAQSDMPRKQVLLSFTGDPYCPENDNHDLTREAIQILLSAGFFVSILSKGGQRCLKDIEVFKKWPGKIKIGATLTTTNNQDSLKWEPGASLPDERMDTLKELHEQGIMTWVSIEPVIYPDQSLELINKTLPYVDQYKIGRWNHDSRANEIDWPLFLKNALTLLKGKAFYIKHDLRISCPDIKIEAPHNDMDYLALKAATGSDITQAIRKEANDAYDVLWGDRRE